MKCNQAGLDLIKSFEGCRLEVYADIVGLATVGYGHRTSLPVGSTITQDEADDLLTQDIAKFESGVTESVIGDISDNQFAALVCFSFNLGLGALKGSTLLVKVNAGDFEGAAQEFLRWDKAGGVVVPGLLRRRQAESGLFLS